MIIQYIFNAKLNFSSVKNRIQDHTNSYNPTPIRMKKQILQKGLHLPQGKARTGAIKKDKNWCQKYMNFKHYNSNEKSF